MSLYSVVVPVYNSEHTLQELYDRVSAVFDEVLHREFELILVDDGSRDRSYELMEELHEKDKRVKIIQHTRNFGQHPALLCGFKYVQGDFVVTMDDDLQHPPEEIPKLIEALDQREDIDVVIASYEGRQHNAIRRAGTWVASYATSKMLHKPRDLDLTSFRVIRRFIVDAVLQMDIKKPQVGNLLVQISNRIINVPVHHDARKYGKSGYSFSRLAKDLFYDITTHSAFPLIVVRDIGILSFIISLILGIFYLARYFIYGVSVEGWMTLVLFMLAYNGVILLSIGIIGEYLMHILDESQRRPLSVVRRKKL